MRRLVLPLSWWVSGALVACSAGDIDGGPFSELEPGVDTKGDDPTPTGGPITTGITIDPGSGTGDDEASTGLDQESTDGEETGDPNASDSDADSSTGARPPADGSTGDRPAACGDGAIDDGEQCDGENLSEMGCADVGEFVGGELGCDDRCAFDTSGCATADTPLEVCEAVNVGIPDLAAGIPHTLRVPAGGTVGDVRLGVDLVHSFIGDLTIDLTHEGTTVRVYDEACTTEDDIDLVFDDAGAALSCAASTSGGNTLPGSPLSAFDGDAAGGDWQILVEDGAFLDTGTLLEVCVYITYG